MAGYTSMAQMMGQTSSPAPVPTQGFAASNILGTPIPAIGDYRGHPNYKGNVGNNASQLQVVGVAVAFIGIGYLIYHFNFEK